MGGTFMAYGLEQGRMIDGVPKLVSRQVFETWSGRFRKAPGRLDRDH
jgi:hypothetical protein